MCMKVFTSSLRLHSKKKVNKELPIKSAQLCSNCSRNISTTSSLPSLEINNSTDTTSTGKINNSHDAVTSLSISSKQKAPSQSSLSSTSSPTATTATTAIATPPSTSANATTAFQDLLGLNSDTDSDLKNTFYQRELPSTLVQFSSNKGKAFFRESMDANHAEGFFPLTGNFTTQSEPAYCGPSSLAMVLNALAVDPKRRWKGVWRWYSDELLECCSSKEQMKKNGITFDEFACLAKCHSDVIAKRAPAFTFEEFQQDVIDVTARSDKFLVVSFSRKTLGQTGDGHFSPIGAYNPANKMVLVLDTARYKYPSYWCPIDMLYESMAPMDKSTGRPRGYFMISYDVEHPPVRLCNMKASEDCCTAAALPPQPQSLVLESNPTTPPTPLAPSTPSTQLNWSTIAQSFCKRIPENMWLEKPRSLEHAIQVVLRNVPSEFTRILANQSISSSKAHSAQQQHDDDDEANIYIQHLLHDTTQSPLYPIVFKTLYADHHQPQPSTSKTATDLSSSQGVDQQAAFATLFILGSPSMLYTSLPRDLQDTLTGYRQDDYMTDVVKREVDRISHEVKELTKSFCTCGPGWTKKPDDCSASSSSCC
ncbi:Phytochelatin synthase-domain-containing protein [Absidia repens]|uniref:glutathione gamma-glutamylcysteinyltransferase n=1 Tax=Absidia repens TaxID=90262 RepID=A0A1X2J0Z5_9FUNG|nr:Phytochelatin synthase-domain-containing protein [Absidia repens]